MQFKTRKELEKIFTIEEVQRFFTTKEDAVSYFDTIAINHKKDLEKLSNIDRVLNQNLWPFSVNNRLINSILNDTETKLKEELKNSFELLIKDAELKKDIISKL